MKPDPFIFTTYLEEIRHPLYCQLDTPHEAI